MPLTTHNKEALINRSDLSDLILSVFESCPGNTVTEAQAITPACIGITLFEPPIFGVAAADDPIFTEFQRDGVVGPWSRLPADWLPGARSVVSIFFPFTDTVRKSNAKETYQASPEWMHARIEGQKWQNEYLRRIADALNQQGIRCAIPPLSPDFHTVTGGVQSGLDAFADSISESTYSSTWSERHTAYACGLGTFALSKGLISKKGLAGRYSSFLIDAEIEPDVRPYTGIYDYCIRCGACVARCPVQAISLEKGKLHAPCRAHQKATERPPRYGCGLCQTGVPCEHGIPG